MAKKTTTAKEPIREKVSAADSDASIDQVRELLFGEQARRLDQRFGLLDERLEALFSQLEDRLQNTNREQSDETRELRAELRSFRQDTENRLAAAEDEWSGQLRDADKALQKKIQLSNNDLQADKVSRTQLAELLNNLAAQLVQDPD